MVDEQKMPAAQSGLDPVTQKEFRLAMKGIDERFQASQEEFRAAMKGIDERFQASQEEFRAAMKGIDVRFEEAKNHAGVLHEDLLHKFDLMLECFAPLSEKVSNHEERLVAIEDEVGLRRRH